MKFLGFSKATSPSAKRESTADRHPLFWEERGFIIRKLRATFVSWCLGGELFCFLIWGMSSIG